MQPLLAQVTSTNGGSIQGTITDASGAAVPAAAISLISTDTGFKKDIKTDGAGYYSIGPLNPGNYKVTVTAPGFETLQVSTVVRVGTATTGSFKLTVGQTNETVEVDAGAVQVNTDQAGVSDVLTAQQIQSLPINGRNFLDVAQVEPGVILQSGGSFDPTKAGYSAISVSGVSGRTTRILLDGQDITDETVGTTIFNVSQGAIGEFQLNRSTQDVSGDVTSTGQVLVATNSGTNKLHGELFYNFQDARSLFATEFGSQPPFQRNQFGGSLGGPLLHNKLFFFGNAERIKQDSGQPAQIGSQFPQFQGLSIPSPYRETYSTIRLDYNGPLGGHYFARVAYNVNSLASNFGQGFNIYANRDNTPGIAGGADFQVGRFTHSFRGSYEKFHNLISDLSQTSPLNLFPNEPITFQNVAQGLYTGPNYLAPQGTFQSDKQLRYDGSWTHGTHTVRFGYNLNRILGGGYAAFFGLAPRVRETAGTVLAQCGNAAIVGPCADDPINGYHASSVVLGNGLGFFTEQPGFGLAGGGTHDWRQAAYGADTWKVTPNLTVVAGLRWSVDTDRANQDLPADPTLVELNPSFNHSVDQPYLNFAPQVGLNYAVLGGKTVFRAGFGIFFEGDVFNNTTNARNALLQSGPFFGDATICGGKLLLPDGTVVTSATVNGVTRSISNLCAGSIASAAPYFSALQQQYQANTAANETSQNGSYIGFTGDLNGVYAPNYRTPYSQQWNFGVQQQITKGAVLSADYIHNSTLKIGQTLDLNHVGAARYLNQNAARNAISATNASFGCSPDATAASTNCAIAAGATISDYAGNGLDSGNQLLGGQSAPANGYTPDTGAAFAGINPNLGNGGVIQPIGKSGYDALQVVFKQQTNHPIPGIERSNLQISYSLSRIVSSSAGGSDQFFSSASWDNDQPNQYIGRASLDHKHEVSFGGTFIMKYGPEIGLIGHFFSALPANLTLDASAPNANIFTSDVTGDGTVGDLLPGTLPGDYMHRVKPNNLASAINGYNATYAGKPSPAGQALINAGLLTQGQLSQLGGVLQTLPTLTGSALANPAFRQIDATFGYPIRLGKYAHVLGESAMLEPRIAFYNVGNFANFGGNSGNPGVVPYEGDIGASGPGYLNGPTGFDVINPYRVTRQAGTYDQGAPRTTEYQLRLTF